MHTVQAVCIKGTHKTTSFKDFLAFFVVIGKYFGIYSVLYIYTVLIDLCFPQWHYTLRLSALVDGTFRVEIDESDPLYPRYRTQLALNGEPKPDM